MTDKKFTDEEIIKALECCTKAVSGARKCEKCPLYTKFQCLYAIKVYALDLINRQKAEIERLTKKVEELAEILSGTIQIRYAEAKAEAYKEFAERLKNEINMRTSLSIEQDKNVIRIIHNLLKEMVGKEE